jgi:hypothetical protein
MDLGFRLAFAGTTMEWWRGRSPLRGSREIAANPDSPSSNFPHIEITRISPPNVSSRGLRRNNSLLHETIFWFWRRHPETVVA